MRIVEVARRESSREGDVYLVPHLKRKRKYGANRIDLCTNGHLLGSTTPLAQTVFADEAVNSCRTGIFGSSSDKQT